MHKLLLLAVIVVLLEPAAASRLPGTSMEPFLLDAEDMLSPFCQLCAIPFHTCIHAMRPAPFAAAQMLYHEQGTFEMPLADFHQQVADLQPIFAFVTGANTQPLVDQNVLYMNANQTKVQPETVQAHIEDIYTPGDRLDETKAGGRRHRRQAPRTRGYPCSFVACDKTFDRACELNRHSKTHLCRSERPHQCDICHQGFLYPKDLIRHQRKHAEVASAQVTFYCPVPGCNNLEGFSRRDNLLRHQRKQHRSLFATA